MQTIVKARKASDFLALVPQLLGFQPDDSIVLVAFQGNRTCACLRFDLPAGPEATLMRIASSLVGMLCRVPGADAVVPVVYTADRFRDTGSAPHEDFVRATVRCAGRSGFLVRGAFCVAADGWGSYLGGYPPAGHPLQDIAASHVVAAIPAAHRVGPGGILDGAVLPEAEPGTRDEVARRYLQYRAGGEPAAPGPVLVISIERMLNYAAAAISHRAAARALWLLQQPVIRDAALLQVAFGPEFLLRGLVECARGDAHARRWRSEAAALLTGDGPRPDPQRILRGIELGRTVTARAPEPARPAPLCMLGWLNWALGRGSVAAAFLEQALHIEPGYPPAVLLLSALDGGQLPQWAFHPSGNPQPTGG